MVHSGFATTTVSVPKCDNACKCSLDWKYALGETIKIINCMCFAAQENATILSDGHLIYNIQQ